MIGLWTSSPTVQRPFILNAHFDGFYTYFAATGFTYGSTPTNWVSMQKWAKENGKIFIPSVGPGYIDTRIRPWNGSVIRNRTDGQYYDAMYRKAIEAGVSAISITSFNEWHEGSQIEPAVPYTSSSLLIWIMRTVNLIIISPALRTGLGNLEKANNNYIC